MYRTENIRFSIAGRQKRIPLLKGTGEGRYLRHILNVVDVFIYNKILKQCLVLLQVFIAV